MLDVCVPHALTDKRISARVHRCQYVVQNFPKEPEFPVKSIVTADKTRNTIERCQTLSVQMPNGNRSKRKQKEKSRFQKSDIKTTLICFFSYGIVKALFIKNLYLEVTPWLQVNIIYALW